MNVFTLDHRHSQRQNIINDLGLMGDAVDFKTHLEDMYKENSITGYIKDNDKIEIDFINNKINLLVTEDEINIRKKNIKINKPEFTGVLKRYSKYIGDIDSGYLLN